jgi:hypothetical protein
MQPSVLNGGNVAVKSQTHELVVKLIDEILVLAYEVYLSHRVGTDTVVAYYRLLGEI